MSLLQRFWVMPQFELFRRSRVWRPGVVQAAKRQYWKRTRKAARQLAVIEAANLGGLRIR
jgi:hypothetical protein